MKRTRGRAAYQEGDYFLVPLQDNLYALGLITRREQRDFKGSAVLAFFFEPASMEPLNPDTPQSFQHRPEDALDIMRFGNLFLLAGIWPIVGHAEPWNRDEWAVSRFAIGDNILKNYQIRYYDPDEPFHKRVRIETVTPDAITGLPKDSSAGNVFVPLRLGRLLQAKYPILNQTQIEATYEALMAKYKPDDENTSDESGEHAVLVYWKLDNNQFGSPETYQTLQRLMDELETSFAERDDIEFDGDEIGEGYATFFFYGSDADAMFSEITRVIKRFKPPEGSYAIKRYGTVGGKEIKVTI